MNIIEVSYDLRMEESMSFVEGCYRVPGQEWCVMILKKRDIEGTEIIESEWESGAIGLEIHVPMHFPLNKASVEGVLAEYFSCSLREVRGPDSMSFR